MFAAWFPSSIFFPWSLSDLLLNLANKKTTLLLVDEVMLCNGRNTTQANFTDVCSLLYEFSDHSIMSAKSSHYGIFMPFLTSLHYDYCCNFTISTQRPLRLFAADVVSSELVEGAFRDSMLRFGSRTVRCLVSMCLGHARSVDRLYRCFGRSPSSTQLPQFISSMYAELNGTAIFRGLGRLEEETIATLAPVLLDQPVRTSRQPSDGPLAIDGCKMVHDGVYFKSFKEVLRSPCFVPSVTVWHLVAASRAVEEINDQSTGWIESLSFLTSSFSFTSKVSFETFTSRALHVRIRALQYLADNPASVYRLQHLTVPLVCVCAHANQQKRPVFALTRESKLYVPSGHSVRRWKVRFSDCLLHVTVPTFPSDFFHDEQEEVADNYFLEEYSYIIRPASAANPSIDVALRLWCCEDSDRDAPFGVTVLVQNKFGKKDLAQPAKIRSYLHAMQEEADALQVKYTQQGQFGERIVLCLCCYGTDGSPSFEAAKALSSEASYLRVSYPAVRYPVIFAGNEEMTGLLGSSLSNFFHGLFMSNDDEVVQ